MHGHWHPVRGDHELVPPLAVPGFLLLRGERLLVGRLELALTQQAQVVARHPDEPGPARPSDPLADAPSLLDHAHRHDPLAGEVGDVFEELEHNVTRALDDADGSEGRVHLAARLGRGQRLEPYVQRDQAREPQRGSSVGDEAAQWGEEGRPRHRRRTADGGQFRRASDDARDVGDDGGARGGFRVEVGRDVD